MKTQNKTKRSGMTIMELMVAQTIFLLGVTGAIYAFMYANRTYHYAQADLQATLRAGSAIETMIYGSDSGMGLREATADDTQAWDEGGWWVVIFNTNYWFYYTEESKQIRDNNWTLICDNVVTSIISQQDGKGINIDISVSETAGGYNFVKRMETFVQYRN